jgi:hypothetical protein
MTRILLFVLSTCCIGCAAELVETDADRIDGRFQLTAVNDLPLPATVSAGSSNSMVVSEGSLFLDTIRDFTLQYRYTIAGNNQVDLYTGKWTVGDGKLTLRNEAGLEIFPDNEASDSLIVLRSTFGGPQGVPFVMRFER